MPGQEEEVVVVHGQLRPLSPGAGPHIQERHPSQALVSPLKAKAIGLLYLSMSYQAKVEGESRHQPLPYLLAAALPRGPLPPMDGLSLSCR